MTCDQFRARRCQCSITEVNIIDPTRFCGQRCRIHYDTNLMAIAPKTSWPWVRAVLHSVYDQPDADAGCTI